jgi:CxxC-x17-CxxC domain-containing protein
MFKAVCDNCGKECQVPFRPTNGKPVYCSDCFEKMGGRADTGHGDFQRQDRPRFESQSQPTSGVNSAQLDGLNAKLDRIIGLLEPKSTEVVNSEAEVKDVKPAKVKKASVKKE